MVGASGLARDVLPLHSSCWSMNSALIICIRYAFDWLNDWRNLSSMKHRFQILAYILTGHMFNALQTRYSYMNWDPSWFLLVQPVSFAFNTFSSEASYRELIRRFIYASQRYGSGTEFCFACMLLFLAVLCLTITVQWMNRCAVTLLQIHLDVKQKM